MKKVEQNILTYKIETNEPIGVIELAQSLEAINKLYARNTKNKEDSIKISEIRKGSYEFDFAICGMLFLENINTAIEFCKNLKNILNFLNQYNENKKIEDIKIFLL